MAASSIPPVEMLLSKSVQEMVLHGEEPLGPYICRSGEDVDEKEDIMDTSPIPIVDLNRLSSSTTSDNDREQELEKLGSALSSWGCFQGIGHGIPASFLDKIRQVSREFFKQPMEEINKYAKTVDDFQGYGADPVPEQEKMKMVTEITSKVVAKSLKLDENCFLEQFGKQHNCKRGLTTTRHVRSLIWFLA